MESAYDMRSDAYESDQMDLSDSDSSVFSNEEWHFNNRRLTQAINYMSAEGGKDRPELFMERVNRLEEIFVQQLPKDNTNFNPKLYRRVRAMIRAVQREYEDAMGHSSLLNNEEDHTADEEDIPDLTTTAAVQVLHEKDSPVQHSATATAQPRRKAPSSNIERQRTWKYDVQRNEPEIWMDKFPCILPFPETFQMAMWESLKIDYDLSEEGKRLKANGVVETNIPFDHPALARFKNLPPYESGSRFTLPEHRTEYERDVAMFASPQDTLKYVNEFNAGEWTKAQNKDQAPRINLEPFAFDADATEKALRRSLNKTPTKIRQAPLKSHVSSKTPPVTKETASHERKLMEGRKRRTSPPPSEPHQSGGGDDHPSSVHPQVIRTPRTANSAALRAFQHGVDAAIRDTPRRHSSLNTLEPPTTTKTARHVAVPAKRVQSQSGNPQAQEPLLSTKIKSKRKAVDSANGTPESKRIRHLAVATLTSPIPKTTSASKKKVTFLPPDTHEAVTRGNTAASDNVLHVSAPVEAVASVAVPVSTLSKAISRVATAGKLTRKKKKKMVFEEMVSPEEYDVYVRDKTAARVSGETAKKRGATRSGLVFKN
ncbi:hypothetical protein ACN47E_000334 [Coniothyrium glycines]